MSEALAIPLRAIALAAYSASMRLGGDAADCFDLAKPCRARLVAIAALGAAYPTASRAQLAACFGGWIVTSRGLAKHIANARCAAWWRASDVDAIVAEVAGCARRKSFELTRPERRVIGALEPMIYVARECESVASPVAASGPVAVAAAACAPRRVSVTTRLLGDPVDAAARRAHVAKLPFSLGKGGKKEWLEFPA